MQTVLITPEGLLNKPGPHVNILREAGFEVRYPKNPLFTRGLGPAEETVAELSEASAVIAGGEYITGRDLDHLPRLRVIARQGVGYDRIDVPGATAHNVILTITPNALHEGVAEQALAFILALAKSVVRLDRITRTGSWTIMQTEPLRGKILGLMGLGRIGRSTAVRAAAFGMKLLATETYPDKRFIEEHGIELVDFDTLLARSDYLSVHCPQNAETRGLFNAKVFAKMKPGSVFINTARGGLVVEVDLVAALQSGHLGGAGLDVFEKEPTKADNPLFQLDNVVVAPHVGGADKLSVETMAITCAHTIVQLSRGEWPEGVVVNQELKGRWRW